MLMVAGAAALFGTLATITRGAEDLGMGAFPLVWWRGIVGTAAMLVVSGVFTYRAHRAGTSGAPWLPRGNGARLLIASLLGAAVNIAMFAAFGKTTIAVVLITFYTFPALVTLFAVPLYGERLTPVRLGALALSATGLALVVLSPLLADSAVRLDPLGIALALLAAVCQASFILMAGRGFAPLSPARVATYAIFAAAAAALALTLVAGDIAGLTVPLHVPEAWVWILLGGITGAAIPTTAFVTGIGLIGPSRAAILMTFEPLVAIALAALVQHEQPSPLQFVGGAAVLVAAVILQLAPSRVPAEPEIGPLV
jgi:drug/metabolite transporter (DMT)-like permease